MDWTAISSIDPGAFSLPLQRALDPLNRRIKALLEFRAAAAGPNPPSNKFFRPGDAINEALRRELLLRGDIKRFYARAGAEAAAADVQANDEAAAVVRSLLTARGGHRS